MKEISRYGKEYKETFTYTQDTLPSCCKDAISDGSNFCTGCGKKLIKEEKEQSKTNIK